MHPILPGIYTIPGLKTGRSYLLEDRDGLTLVDTSSQGCASKILAAIEAIGRKPEELHTIVATHYHHDHTGNVARLREQTRARLYVHAEDAPFVGGRRPWTEVHGWSAALAQRFGPKPYHLKVDDELREGDVVRSIGGLVVVHLPGHTPGNIGLLSREQGVVFTGDALMNVLGLRLPLAVSSHDMGQAKESVRKLAGFDFEHALPGHGEPILGRASTKIAELANRW
jgi:glyoxylase-like metal-dependent hydrolase (beta-lactamase superfamily II)